MDMKNITEILFELIKSALNETEPEIPADIDWDTLYAIAKYHSITGLISYPLAGCGAVPAEIREKLDQDQLMGICREVNQDVMVSKALEAFEENGIDCMPLKGFILKHLYPTPDMRDMCDVDILIHEEDIDRIKQVMADQEFEYEKESPHEFIFSSSLVTVELHKCLVASYNKDLYAYYGDGWKTAKKKQGYEHVFEMSKEDFYVYTLAHLAKHYINSGAGIKQVIDVYVLREKCPGLDYGYIKEQLREIGIDKFHDILCELVDVWFGDAEYNDDTRRMAEYIIKSGTYGTKLNADNSLIYKGSEDGDYSKTKRRFMKNSLFPSCEVLAKRYTVLEKHSWLYLFVNIYRWFDILLNRREKVKENMAKTVLDNDGVSEFAHHCESVGLNRTL